MRCSLPGRVIFQLTHPVWKCSGVANLPQIMQAPFQLTHPVRGATQTIMCFPPHIQKLAIKFFNSRTPRGVRPGSAWIQTGFSHFNSRTRVGCDKIKWYTNFNSRTHAGCDVSREYCNVFMLISIPAPRVGATRLIPRRPWKSDISIPAPCEGCDIILIKKKRRRLVFQFTHPVWGAAQRLRTDILKIIIKYFNSRTLMRYGLTVSP